MGGTLCPWKCGTIDGAWNEADCIPEAVRIVDEMGASEKKITEVDDGSESLYEEVNPEQ